MLENNSSNDNGHQTGDDRPGHSTGPRSESGKQRSSQNATKHGGYSHRIVLANEDQSAFDDLLARYMEDWQPVNQTELDLVTQMAINQWKFLRYNAQETALIDSEMFLQRSSFDAAFTDTTAEMRQSDAVMMLHRANAGLETISRFANRASRAYEKALRLLVWHRKQRDASTAPALKAAQAIRNQADTDNHRNELPDPSAAPAKPAKPAPTPRLFTGTVPAEECFRFESTFIPNADRPCPGRAQWKSPDEDPD